MAAKLEKAVVIDFVFAEIFSGTPDKDCANDFAFAEKAPAVDDKDCFTVFLSAKVPRGSII